MPYNRSLDGVLCAWADSAYDKAPSGLNLSCDSEGALYSYRMMIARHVGATATWALDPNAQPNPSPSVTTTRHMRDAWSYSARDNRAVLLVPNETLLRQGAPCDVFGFYWQRWLSACQRVEAGKHEAYKTRYQRQRHAVHLVAWLRAYGDVGCGAPPGLRPDYILNRDAECDRTADETFKRNAAKRARRMERETARSKPDVDEWLHYAGIVAPAGLDYWLLRACDRPYISRNGFRYPTDGMVYPDGFDPSDKACSDGLHGLFHATGNAQYLPRRGAPQILLVNPAAGYCASDGKVRVSRAWVLPVPKRILLPLLNRLDCLRTGAEPGDPAAHLRLAARRLTHG